MKTLQPRTRTRVERILEPFGANHSSGLIEFFEAVAKADVDVVIFMARKSLCLYRVMVLCGIKKIQAEVYSDAILDGDCRALSDKNILIVDDTLFVGTTLAETKERLECIATKNLKFWVYCVDQETWKSKTFVPDYVHAKMSAQEAIEFCAAECRALINAAVPYLTDFAASKRLRFTPKELDQIIKPIHWFFHDVSSQYHDRSKVKYYSAIPDQFANEQVKKVIGPQLFDLIELAKLRVFATWNGRAYEVTFVPVVTFAPTDKPSLKKATIYLCKLLDIDPTLFNESSVMEEMRYLQFIVGALFLRTYWDFLDGQRTTPSDSKFEYQWCSAVFTPTIATSISQAIAGIYSENYVVPKKPFRLPKLAKPEPREVAKETHEDIDEFLSEYFSGYSDVDFGHTPLSDLTAIFLEFQSNFENKARQEIIDDVDEPQYRDRLKRGMAWRALSSYILKKYRTNNTRFNRNILSLVLDRMVDFGIAVPIISSTNNHVYRAYRHGEDVRFGAQEENLVFNILAGFGSGRGRPEIEATYLEKLVVILLRVGMNEEWLNLWYSHSGRDSLARIGYHLQGAVAISPRREDELVPEGESSWLTRRMCKTGTIQINEQEGKKPNLYYLGTEPEAAHVRVEAPRNAKVLGNALGKACTFSSKERTAERPISAEDLIVLTSCSNPLDTTGAIAAELMIFSDWYKQTGCRILSGNFSNPKSKSFRLIYPGNKAFQAINSGKWKLQQFRAGAIDAIKQKIYALKEIDPEWFIREDFWEAIFRAFEREPSDKERQKIEKLLIAFDDIMQCCLFSLEALLHLAKLGENIKNKQSQDKLLQLLKTATPPEAVVTPNFAAMANALRQVSKGSHAELSRVLNDISNHMNSYISSLCALANEESEYAEQIVLKANERLSRIQYNHLVWYDILDIRVRKQGNPDATDTYAEATNKFRAAVSRLLSETQDRIRKSGGDLFCDTGEIRSWNDEKHLFFAGSGGMVHEANRLACDIMRLAARSGVSLRILSLPTNLRGEFVYLNKGTTSIDKDFKSHMHTIVEDLKGHDMEVALEIGESVWWTLSEFTPKIRSYGSLNLDRSVQKGIEKIEINIRGFIIENNLSCVICRK